jgi:hypothetical protein
MIAVDRNAGGTLFTHCDHIQFFKEFDRTRNRRDVRARHRCELLLCEFLEGIVRKVVKDVLHRLVPEDTFLQKREIEKDV